MQAPDHAEPEVGELAPGGLRPQALLLTFCGIHLLGRDVNVATTSVLEVLDRVGVSEHATRSTLSRMARRGLLHRVRRGRKVYLGLTSRSREILRDGEMRVWHTGAVNLHWNGTWTLLGFSLPDSWQRQRHELRSRLLWAGFGPLQGGLWISPSHVDIVAVTAGLQASAHVRAFEARALPPTEVDGLLRDAWDLDAIAERYRGFVQRWQPPQQPAPGILPAAYMRSSKSTVSGKKSRPGRGSERLAVPRTIVSPNRTVTDPPASRAMRPVSTVSVRPANWVSKTCGTGCKSSLPCRGTNLARVDPELSPRSPALSGRGGFVGLAAESEPSDDGAVACAVLLQQVREKATALADELEEAASRVIVLREASEVVGQGLDPLRQERDLDLRRPGIAVGDGVLGNGLLLPLGRERQLVLQHERNYFLSSTSLTMTGGW